MSDMQLQAQLIDSPDIDDWLILADWHADRGEVELERLWRMRHAFGRVLLPRWKRMIDAIAWRVADTYACVGEFRIRIYRTNEHIMSSVSRGWQSSRFVHRTRRTSGACADSWWPAQLYLRRRLFDLVRKTKGLET